MRELWIAVALGSVGSSCGFITAGAASAASDDSSPSDAPAAITGFAVEDAKTEPARIRFVLADAEGDSVEVELRYEVDPDGAGPKAAVSGKLQHLFEPRPSPPTNPPPASTPLRNPLVLAASPQGTEHVFDWFFTREAGIGSGTFTDDVFVFAQVTGGVQSLTPGANAARLGVGNDPPVIVADQDGFADAQIPSAEVVGLARVTFLVADSSLDQVDVHVEYALADGLDVDAGELPDASSFQPATPDGQPPMAIQTIEGGTSVDFFWNPVADLGRTEHDVVLRITPSDRDEQGETVETGAPVLTHHFRIDNNAAPIIQFDSGALLANPDERRGIPIPYRVIDEESDLVDVIFQWRREGEQFPFLPMDNALLDAILADPASRREHHICTEAPRYARGRVIPVDATTVRLPELAQQESWIVARGVVGGTLELLRASQFPVLIESSWSANPLDAPVAALPLGDGLTALVLDGTGSGGWRVREIELATGEVVSELVTGAGTPTAMALARAEGTLFVASSSGQWTVDRFDLSGGVAVPSGSVVGTSASPDGIRGLAATSPSTVLTTVDDELRRLDFAAIPPSSVTLFTGLGEPWGVVADPLEVDHAYVALRTEHRVVHVDLATRALTTVPAEILGGTGLSLPNPRALALERNGARLLAVVQRLGGKVFLRGLNLRSGVDHDEDGVANPAVFDLATDFDPRSSIATGPETLRVMALPSANGLAVGGGVEQRRTVAAYEPEGQRLHVEPAFELFPGTNQTWRLEGKLLHGSAAGVDNLFLWDTSVDVPESGSTLLRAIASDTEPGTFAHGAAPKRVRAALDVAPLVLGGSGTTNDPQSVAVADFDDDGDLDLVSANGSSNNLTVFFQSSPGNFDPAPLVLGGSGTTNDPRSVTVADFDDDGDLDLVSANGSSNNLTVFFQSSPGNFDPAPLVLGGSGTTNDPRSVTAADLDGDSDLDLVSANGSSNNLTVFFQSSPGNFDPAPLVVGAGTANVPSSVAAADVDGDGDPDLVSAHSGSDSLTVFFQNSPGSFDPLPLVLGGFGLTVLHHSVAAADIDGDGHLDLVSTNSFSDTLRVFFQSAPGTFPGDPLTIGGFETTNNPASVAASDLDGDGDLDLVSANSGSSNLTVFLQSSPGNFDPVPLVLGSSGTTNVPLSVAAADLDGDGDPDLVSANSDSGNLTVFLQSSPGNFDPAPLALGSLGKTNAPWSVAAADLDGDGDPDLVSANSLGNDLTLFFQSSPGNFDPAPLVLGGSGTTNVPLSVAAADLDGDADLDVVSANSGSSSNLTVFLQSSPGNFDPAPLVIGGPGTTNIPFSVAAADLDGDGDRDLVSANGNNLTVFLQGSPGSFDPAPLVLGGVLFSRSVAAADLDGDGDLDLVSANGGSNDLRVFFQSSPANFDSAPLVLGGSGTTKLPFSVAAADLDGDGDPDLVSANSGSGNLTVFLQSSPGNFDPAPLVLGGFGTTNDPRSVAAADLDGDGDADLVSANSVGSNLTVFLQSSPGNFDPAPLVLGGFGTTSGPHSVAAADLDGDGELDLVSANDVSNNLTLFFGGRR